MTRRNAALYAAVEGLLIVAIGLAIPMIPLTIVWALEYGLQPPWSIVARVSGDVWFLGHGVDVSVRLDAESAAALPLAQVRVRVALTMAVLGGALVSILLAARGGRRLAEAQRPLLGIPITMLVVAACSLGLALLLDHPAARISLTQAVILPALIVGGAALAGAWRAGIEIPDDGPLAALADQVERIPHTARLLIADALRAGAALVATVLAAASIMLAAALLLAYAEVISLYESLYTQVLGGIALTAAQLLLLPNLVIWTASWLLGPGFAVGTGSSVTVFETALGPIPPIPVFGAIPADPPAVALIGLAIPVALAFLIGVGVRRHHDTRREDAGLETTGARGALALAGVGALTAGLLFALLALAASGSAGPGRFAEVGPDPLAVGLVAALDAFVGFALGAAVSGRRDDGLRAVIGRGREAISRPREQRESSRDEAGPTRD